MVKIKRTYPAPESLAIEAKKNGSYSMIDVVEQLRHDFHDKCYICGLGKLPDGQVEHLLPHHNGKYIDRKFDWDNLFWSCAHCNSVKNKAKYDEKIINCCKEDPEEHIDFILENGEIKVKAKQQDNENAMLTASLIMDAFNQKNTGLQTYKSEHRRNALNLEMNAFYDALEELEGNASSRIAIRKIQALLRRESQFAAFKRNYVRMNLEKFPLLCWRDCCI